MKPEQGNPNNTYNRGRQITICLGRASGRSSASVNEEIVRGETRTLNVQMNSECLRFCFIALDESVLDRQEIKLVISGF